MMPETVACVDSVLLPELSAIVLTFVGHGRNIYDYVELGLWEVCMNTDRLQTNNLFIHACRLGEVEIARSLSAFGFCDEYYGVSEAFWNDQQGIADLFKPTNKYESCKMLDYGCRSANLKMIEFVIRHGADNFDDGLSTACAYGAWPRIIGLMIKHGARRCDNPNCKKKLDEHVTTWRFLPKK